MNLKNNYASIIPSFNEMVFCDIPFFSSFMKLQSETEQELESHDSVTLKKTGDAEELRCLRWQACESLLPRSCVAGFPPP